MKRVPLLAATCLLAGLAPSPAEEAEAPPGVREGRPVHTYSIVARDPDTGRLGVAVQSHWFQVGALVPWARAGVGAVATQSFVEVSYGPRGLRLMEGGHDAREALDRLLEQDADRDVRQVGMVDAEGRAAAWTGPRCIAAAGHYVGDGYTVQANLMERASVWPAMAEAFEASVGRPFAERLLAALGAAEAEGGDIRGRQSAALLIVRAKTSGRPWEDRLVDLRVEDHPRPLEELERLLGLHRAYEAMNAGDAALAAGEVDAALAHYTEAVELAPRISELPFWKAVTLFDVGREQEALEMFREVFAEDPRWVALIERLPDAGLLPADEGKLDEILAQAPGAVDATPGEDPSQD
jgi:uncharacterized Ntn-hydrolase superfamily protein